MHHLLLSKKYPTEAQLKHAESAFLNVPLSLTNDCETIRVLFKVKRCHSTFGNAMKGHLHVF